jgi:hypothetical protein
MDANKNVLIEIRALGSKVEKELVNPMRFLKYI